jgi:hypothetical protein
MSLRKSPQRTPKLVAANRRNARFSTGPRTLAGKQNARVNALKHGRWAKPEVLRHARLRGMALGEDREEFEHCLREEETARV